MKSVSIELLPPNEKRVRLLKALALGITLTAAAEFAGLGFALARLAKVETDTAALNDRLLALNAQLGGPRRARSFDGAAQAALRAAQFPLEAALSSLEEFGVPEVQIRSVEFDLQEGFGKAELEALNLRALAKYLQTLTGPDSQSHWRVVSIREVADQVDPMSDHVEPKQGVARPSLTACKDGLLSRHQGTLSCASLEWRIVRVK